MKKFSILLLSFLAIVVAISCDDNEEELFINEPSSGLAFESTAAASYLLTFETKDNLAERLVWNDIEFETPVSVNYEVQASNDPANFDTPAVVTSTNDNFVDISVERLNQLSAELGLTPFSQGVIAMRVVGTTADSTMEPLISDVLVLSVTPYTTESPRLWVPGNYAASSGYGADWAPGDADTPFIEAVEFGSTEYEGFIFMNVATPNFKFTLEQDWDEAYGDGGTGLLDLNGGDLSVPGPGYYYITVNTDPDGDPSTNDATWTATATSWAMIGTATPNDWNDPDTDMTYNSTTRKWEVDVTLSQAEFKFRSNDDWSSPLNNFGENSDGELEFNAGNFTFDQSAGLYKVELDLSQPRNYTYTATGI
ncbi:SusE domain-containing protein [Nonlabens sp.]|uniref:SusE domain-containing protein n=1 Tax=Nonlabens sp. TaxID=1888209 RepID=UPI003F6A1A60